MKFEETITYMAYADILRALDAVKTANKSAYTSNTYWKMGFDAAYDAVVYNMKLEREVGNMFNIITGGLENETNK